MRDPESDVDAAVRRERRLAEIVAELTTEHRSLAPAMTEAEFHGMVQRLADQQLLYEEFGDER